MGRGKQGQLRKTFGGSEGWDWRGKQGRKSKRHSRHIEKKQARE